MKANYHDLYVWSCENIAAFWEILWKELGIIHSASFTRVIDESLTIDKLPVWFEGAQLNYAENLLKFRDDGVAIIATSELFLNKL